MSSITTQGVTISFDNGVKPYMHDASTDIQKMQTPKADIQPDLAVIEVRKTKAHVVHCPLAPYPAAAGNG
jgi:hypothetical protein